MTTSQSTSIRGVTPNYPEVRFLELMTKWTGTAEDASGSDNWYDAIRELIIGEEFPEEELLQEEKDRGIIPDLAEAKDLIEEMRVSPYYRDTLSRTCLDMSLCPVHFTDYAECFEEEYPECEGVRIAFPTHDT